MLDSVCRDQTPVARATSVAYFWLQHVGSVELAEHRRGWSEDLRVDISDKQWRYVCILAHKCSISTKLQETSYRYKLLTRWYNTLDKLHKWDAQKPDVCWRCQKDTGTLIHIWWNCSLISAYWEEVRFIIKQITETKLDLKAACCLLHLSSFSLTRYKHSLTKHLLNAAKSLIPLHWNSTRVPSISEWLQRVADVCEMEDTLAQDRGSVVSFHETWQPWFAFRFSREYETVMHRQSTGGPT